MLNSSNDENVKEQEPVDDSQRSQVDGNSSVNDPKVSELRENPKQPKEVCRFMASCCVRLTEEEFCCRKFH